YLFVQIFLHPGPLPAALVKDPLQGVDATRISQPLQLSSGPCIILQSVARRSPQRSRRTPSQAYVAGAYVAWAYVAWAYVANAYVSGSHKCSPTVPASASISCAYWLTSSRRSTLP